MKLSLIMPVYNEERTIEKILDKVLAVTEVFEVVLVNDGSTDQTRKILDTIKHKKLRIFHKKNGGKGSAVRFGLEQVRGDYCLIQDADLEYHPADIKDLIQAVESRGVPIVFGSRFIGPHSNLLFWHLIGNKFLNFLINILYDTTLSDMETCYKLIPTEMFRSLNIQSQKFDMEPEITCKLLRKGVSIYEVPISYVGRNFAEGKKISWRDGIDAVKTILKWKVFPLS